MSVVKSVYLKQIKNTLGVVVLKNTFNFQWPNMKFFLTFNISKNFSNPYPLSIISSDNIEVQTLLIQQQLSFYLISPYNQILRLV